MTELVFVLTDEQVRLLGLDPGTWWGVPLMDADDDHRKTAVTRDAEVLDVMLGVLEEGTRPPVELELWAASEVFDVPGWPEDW